MTTVSEDVEVLDRPAAPRWPKAGIGVAVLALGLGGAVLGHWLLPAVGILTWSIAQGGDAAARSADQEAPAARHRPARVLGLLRLHHRARPSADRRRRGGPGRNARFHDVARGPDGSKRAQR